MMTPETINLPNSLIDSISTWIHTDYYHLKSFEIVWILVMNFNAVQSIKVGLGSSPKFHWVNMCMGRFVLGMFVWVVRLSKTNCYPTHFYFNLTYISIKHRSVNIYTAWYIESYLWLHLVLKFPLDICRICPLLQPSVKFSKGQFLDRNMPSIGRQAVGKYFWSNWFIAF